MTCLFEYNSVTTPRWTLVLWIHPPKNAYCDIIEILLNKDVFVQPVTLVEQELPTPFASP